MSGTRSGVRHRCGNRAAQWRCDQRGTLQCILGQWPQRLCRFGGAMTIAFVFPGQGSQTLGMGEDFRSLLPTVRQRFEQASDRLGVDLGAVIGKGPPGLLAQTHIAQPAIFTLSYALGELLVARGLQPSWAAGHSLGEFTAVA